MVGLNGHLFARTQRQDCYYWFLQRMGVVTSTVGILFRRASWWLFDAEDDFMECTICDATDLTNKEKSRLEGSLRRPRAPETRELLRERNSTKTGNKAALVERIEELHTRAVQ